MQRVQVMTKACSWLLHCYSAHDEWGISNLKQKDAIRYVSKLTRNRLYFGQQLFTKKRRHPTNLNKL